MRFILAFYSLSDCSNCSATWTTQVQLSSHVRTFVDKISPEKDLGKVKSVIPRSLASAIPDPILYEHGQVGPCNDLIFGFSLVDYATSKAIQEGEIPKILRICIEELDKRGLDNEGIYRVSPLGFNHLRSRLTLCEGFWAPCSCPSCEDLGVLLLSIQ
jgi:hypothetical protein